MDISQKLMQDLKETPPTYYKALQNLWLSWVWIIIKSISFVPGDPSEWRLAHSVTWCKIRKSSI